MAIKRNVGKQSSFTWRFVCFAIHLQKWLLGIELTTKLRKFKISNSITITMTEVEKNKAFRYWQYNLGWFSIPLLVECPLSCSVYLTDHLLVYKAEKSSQLITKKGIVYQLFHHTINFNGTKITLRNCETVF